MRTLRAPKGDQPDVESAQPEASPHETAPQPERQQLLRQAEVVVSHVLRWGVILSAAIIALGVVLFYAQYLTGHVSTAQAQAFPHTLAAEIAALQAGQAVGVIVLGLLLLLLTPVMRVAVSIVVFAIEHDWLYTVITLIVLIILFISFFSGRGGA